MEKNFGPLLDIENPDAKVTNSFIDAVSKCLMIGKGREGESYRVTHDVVVKVMKVRTVLPSEAITGPINEALFHGNYGFDHSPKTKIMLWKNYIILVMEYVGQNLTKIKEEHQFRIDLLPSLLEQMAEILYWFDLNNVIHSDIRLANLCIKPVEDGKFKLSIIDFGGMMFSGGPEFSKFLPNILQRPYPPLNDSTYIDMSFAGYSLYCFLILYDQHVVETMYPFHLETGTNPCENFGENTKIIIEFMKSAGYEKNRVKQMYDMVEIIDTMIKQLISPGDLVYRVKNTIHQSSSAYIEYFPRNISLVEKYSIDPAAHTDVTEAFEKYFDVTTNFQERIQKLCGYKTATGPEILDAISEGGLDPMGTTVTLKLKLKWDIMIVANYPIVVDLYSYISKKATIRTDTLFCCIGVILSIFTGNCYDLISAKCHKSLKHYITRNASLRNTGVTDIVNRTVVDILYDCDWNLPINPDLLQLYNYGSIVKRPELIGLYNDFVDLAVNIYSGMNLIES